MKQTPQMKARLEAAGHQAALLYLDKLAVRQAILGPVELLEAHRLLFDKSWPESAGRFRNENIEITGTSYLPPHWQQVPALTHQALAATNERLAKLQDNDVAGLVEAAAHAHYGIAAIHPFRDGNGRIARLMLNYVFRYFGLPYVVIPLEERDRYMNALDAANHGDLTPFIALTLERYEHALDSTLEPG